MSEDFRLFCEEAKSVGKRDAWKRYYTKYNEIFDGMLKYLYMMDLENFKSLIENTDFQYILNSMEMFIGENKIPEIEEIINRCIEDLKFNIEFDLYLGVGLGHVDGTALLLDRPVVYFGLERLLNHNLKIIVPHEFNHMARFYYTDFNGGKNRLVDRIITEGLGTFSSIAFLDTIIDIESISKALMVSEKCVYRLIEIEDKIKEEIFKNLNLEMNQSFMTRYFASN